MLTTTIAGDWTSIRCDTNICTSNKAGNSKTKSLGLKIKWGALWKESSHQAERTRICKNWTDIYITNKSYIDPWGMLTQHFVCACDRIGPLKYSKKNWSHWIACMPLENLTRIKKTTLLYLNGLAKRVANAFWHPVWARLRLTASAPGLSQSWGIAYGRSQSARCFRCLSMSFSRNHWRSSYHVIFPSCGIPRSRAFLDPSSTSPLPIIYS